MSPPIDTEEFVKLLAQYDREVFRYVLTLLADRTAAEDVLQGTCAALWVKLAEYDREQPFLPWALSFARLEVQKYRRRASRHPLHFDNELVARVADIRANDQSLLESRRRALNLCLDQLPPQDRQLLQARYEAGQTVASLAQARAMPVKRLYNALDRIRRRLMDCVQQRLAGEDS